MLIPRVLKLVAEEIRMQHRKGLSTTCGCLKIEKVSVVGNLLKDLKKFSRWRWKDWVSMEQDLIGQRREAKGIIKTLI
jgi:hypothetical protein